MEITRLHEQALLNAWVPDSSIEDFRGEQEYIVNEKQTHRDIETVYDRVLRLATEHLQVHLKTVASHLLIAYKGAWQALDLGLFLIHCQSAR